jgi:hypothetical protein
MYICFNLSLKRFFFNIKFMSILQQLSSQTGNRCEQPNRDVARQCIENAKLLEEIEAGFKSKDVKLIGDCAEVMTFVAETNPELISKYFNELHPLIKHKNGRIKWEAMHAISHIAHLVPDHIFSILVELDDILHKEQGVIVRDYATQTICNYAQTGKEAAGIAYPVMKEILHFWGERHASRVIDALSKIYSLLPGLKNELLVTVSEYENSSRGIIKKAVSKLKKTLN